MTTIASPPRTVNAASGWRVKSEHGEEARELCTQFEHLEPRLGALLPDWQLPTQGEIWIQEEPKLYAFPAAAKSDAEGLWAENERCILLARGADDLERTLAHEMVHAGLGPSWRMLPGSFEEGLCDWAAAHVARKIRGDPGAVRVACAQAHIPFHACESVQQRAEARLARVRWEAQFLALKCALQRR